MDFNALKDQVSNLTFYDLKAGVRKVQNAVMNYTEMEAKVREATNNEPWGASSTLMQEIANGTHSYQLLNEIMPMIYKRFTEKAAEEWRQIYKALQLLEFLIKNGSERVVDDARSHISLLKMLRQFHFIDQNGKDQGVNVRNRSKELTELLSDVERIRAERKKARNNRNKFGGVEGGGIGMGLSSSSRYGGFGNEDSSSYGAYSGGVYGDGGGFGGNTSGFQDSGSRRDRFEEYDEYDEGAVASPTRRRQETTSSASKRDFKKTEVPKPKEPEIDMLSFDNDVPPKTPQKDSSADGKKPVPNAMDDDFGAMQSSNAVDDFDDFQSATPRSSKPSSTNVLPSLTATSIASTQLAAPKPVSGSQGATLDGLVSFNSISPAPNFHAMSSPIPGSLNLPQQPPSHQPIRPTGYQATQPNYFTSVQAPSIASSQPSSSSTGTGTKPSFPPTSPSFHNPLSSIGGKPSSSTPSSSGNNDAFSSLWSSASAEAGIKKTNNLSTSRGPNLASLAKQKANAGIWGATATTSGTTTAPPQSRGHSGMTGQLAGKGTGGGLDDLLG